MREFFTKNAIVRAFFKGFDRKDEKLILNFFKTSELEMGERLVRRDTKDRSIIFIVSGEFLKFSDPGQPNIEYKEGAVIGVEEFLKNREWPKDIICS